jgi:phosphoribosylformylglycinamidine cyclo-ligase
LAQAEPGGATYAGAGVDIAAGDAAVEKIKGLVAGTLRPEVLDGIGGFGGLFQLDRKRYRRPVLVSATDGVGTKMVVANATQRFDTIGIDLVAMCVDDVVCTGAEPLFFLDYISQSRLDPDRVATIVGGIAKGCERARCALIGGETAEHPDALNPDHLDLAGFAVGVVEKGERLGPHQVHDGQILIGLASPGLRCNGYSLARHVLFNVAGRRLDDLAWEGAEHSLADELLKPSVIYASAVRGALSTVGGIAAAAHITGGGIPGNLSRVLPSHCDAVLEWGSWPVPPIFAELHRLGSIADAEMAQVFNLGLGMVLVVERAKVAGVQRVLASHDVEPLIVGDIVAGTGEVRLK